MNFECSKELRSSYSKLLAVVIVAFMAFSAFALFPDEQTDAEGKTVTVSSWDELKQELSHPEDGETIILGADISTDDGVTIENVKNLTIDLGGHVIDRGPGGPGYDEGGQIKFDSGAAVTIKNGTLEGGYVDNGGGLYIKGGSSVTLNDVNITSAFASEEGGGIFIKESTLVIKGGTISGCNSEDDGGFLRATDSSNVTIDGVKFSENESGEKGGTIHADGGATLTITNCDFFDSFSADDGGAIYLGDTGEISIVGCSFRENTSYASGGAICIEDADGTINILGCTFNTNEAGEDRDWDDGGAIFVDDSKVIIGLNGETGCQFSGNVALNNGGAIRNYGGDIEIRGAEFGSNNSWDKGGAIYSTDDGTILVEDCNITKNKAGEGGGGIYMGDDDDRLKIQGLVVIKDNEHGSYEEGFLGVSNVYICDDNVIECGTLRDGSEIGIELEEKDRVFTKGYQASNPDKDPAMFFKTLDGYYVALDPDAKEVKFYGGSSGDMSDNTIWIVVGIIAAIAVIGIAVYFVKFRKP